MHRCFVAVVHLTFHLSFSKFSRTWVRKYCFTIFSKVLFFSLVSSLIVLLFFPFAHFIFWFYLSVDFCDNWLCQEIKSFRSTQLLSIFYQVRIWICWKNSSGYYIRMFSIVSALLELPKHFQQFKVKYVIFVTKGHVSKTLPYLFLFSLHILHSFQQMA